MTLFGLLNSIAVFMLDSYAQIIKWEENSKYKVISVIGETRWWPLVDKGSLLEEHLLVDIINT